ncbi:MAG: hypothetical protein KME57_11040 [Scytonema hyalinum WJT4-NPBG1]|nr:hypothetical protein [Scytonema hyalinum WJT4-NPBG1]
MQPAILPLNTGIFRVLPAFSLSSSAEYYPKSAALESDRYHECVLE